MSQIWAEFIRRKRFGHNHSAFELKEFISAYVKGDIPDYQVAAWLMAVCFQGMTSEETTQLTIAMRDSGEVVDLSKLGITVDKHSTGGVGDKTSLLIAPIVAASGVKVPMMAGRGLGHTGGTLDKLESIPGFRVELPLPLFKEQLDSVGAAIIGQSKDICPADRKIYALRDVTGTVDSLPLICASIMSKKLAEGMSALILDVKYGTGAFMKTVAQAEELGRALIAIGKSAGKSVRALITNMNEPLGRFVGNSLEVEECLHILRCEPSPKTGKSWGDTVDLTLQLCAHMLHASGKCSSVENGLKLARDTLRSGKAYKKFAEICEAQGGRLNEGLRRAPQFTDVKAETAGFFSFTNCAKIGLAAIHLGAGRIRVSDKLDLSAGIEILVNLGDKVSPGDTLFRLFHGASANLDAAKSELKNGFKVQSINPAPSQLIEKVLK